MLRRLVLVVGSLLLIGTLARAVDPLPLLLAEGAIEKVEKDSLSIHPRGADGKFLKAVTLKVTGTSKVSTLAPRTQAGKVVLTQRDTEVKDLKTGQIIAVIYTNVKDGSVLLSGVVQQAKE